MSAEPHAHAYESMSPSATTTIIERPLSPAEEEGRRDELRFEEYGGDDPEAPRAKARPDTAGTAMSSSSAAPSSIQKGKSPAPAPPPVPSWYCAAMACACVDMLSYEDGTEGEEWLEWRREDGCVPYEEE